MRTETTPSVTLNKAQSRFYLAVNAETLRILASGTSEEREALWVAAAAGNTALGEYQAATPDYLYSCDTALDIYRKAFSAVLWSGK